MLPVGTIASLLLTYRYLVIVPLSLVAQPLVGMLGGVLARLGYFDPFILYGVLVGTAVCGDIVWYWVGSSFGEGLTSRFGKYVNIRKRHVEQVKKAFNRYHTSILFFSKLTNGVGFANVVLFTAGLTRVPFWRFVGVNIIGEGLWSAGIVSIGYFFGHIYVTVDNILGRAAIIMGGFILVALAFGFAHYLRRRIMRKVEQE